MSRRAAEEAILSGRVVLNGETAGLGDKADPAVDQILVDGKALAPGGQKLYIMLNKPRGVVTTLSDEKGRRTVVQLLEGVTDRVYPVGRLDLDSEGLLLLTNDGELANRMMHPSHEVVKTYRTWVQGSDLDKALELLAGEMRIDGYPIRPALILLLKRTEEGGVLDISIHEGRNRQVRKMCAQAGLRVTRLCRISEGPLRLGELKTGCWRYLSPEEVKRLHE